MNGRAWKVAAVALASSLGLALVGCADAAAPNPSATRLELSGPAVEHTEPAAEPATQQPDSTPTPLDDAPGTTAGDDRGGVAPQTAALPTGRHGAPCAVTGYSGEGESDRREEGFTRQQVADAVSQGCEVAEYDDGVWEIDLDWIGLEIRPDGTVIEVDD